MRGRNGVGCKVGIDDYLITKGGPGFRTDVAFDENDALTTAPLAKYIVG